MRDRLKSVPHAVSDRLRQLFLEQAEACEVTGSPLYAAVRRRLADAQIVDEIVPDERWDIPIRLLGALHYITLSEGVGPWAEPAAAIAERHDWVANFLVTRRVQTNEVQRAWALLPAFLSLGAPRLDLLELGPSAGLNLVWDRYRYRYLNDSWGPPDAALELVGDERSPVPADLLERSVDATTDEGARLLRCFVWADQQARLERLDRAIAALRLDPPTVIQGDYVDPLPSLQRGRVDDALQVVYQTASTLYLPD